MGLQERLIRSAESGESSIGSEYCIILWAKLFNSLTVVDSAILRSAAVVLRSTEDDEMFPSVWRGVEDELRSAFLLSSPSSDDLRGSEDEEDEEEGGEGGERIEFWWYWRGENSIESHPSSSEGLETVCDVFCVVSTDGVDERDEIFDPFSWLISGMLIFPPSIAEAAEAEEEEEEEEGISFVFPFSRPWSSLWSDLSGPSSTVFRLLAVNGGEIAGEEEDEDDEREGEGSLWGGEEGEETWMRIADSSSMMEGEEEVWDDVPWDGGRGNEEEDEDEEEDWKEREEASRIEIFFLDRLQDETWDDPEAGSSPFDASSSRGREGEEGEDELTAEYRVGMKDPEIVAVCPPLCCFDTWTGRPDWIDATADDDDDDDEGETLICCKISSASLSKFSTHLFFFFFFFFGIDREEEGKERNDQHDVR